MTVTFARWRANSSGTSSSASATSRLNSGCSIGEGRHAARTLARRRTARGCQPERGGTCRAARDRLPARMPPTPVHFGIQTPQEGVTYETLAAHWHEADSLGFDSVWLDDHFYPIIRPQGEPQMEAWTLLAALPPETRRTRLGSP